MTWDNFLREIADEFGLSPGETEIFLIRWSEENKEKSEKEVENDIPKETENYKKVKTAIFKKFEFGQQQPNGCKTLEDAGPQKGKRLLEWLEEKYHEWLQAHPEPEGKTDRSVQSSDDIDWLRVCRQMWAKQREDQRIRRKVTERGFEVNVYVGLGLVQRVQQQRRQGEMDRDEILALTDTEAIAHTYEHDQFLDQVIGQEPRGQNRHIAIIGEPGAGKSTLLAAIANHLTKDESKIMPICLSLAGLQGKTIKDYLLDIWLPEAIKLAYPEIVVVEDSHENSFQQWLRQGQVWLLLDGLDEIGDRAPAQVQNDIKNELTDWLGYVRVALTCRLNVWDASLNNVLTGFDTYKMDKFKPDDIKKFIHDWFKQAKKPEAGQILQNQLDESKYTNLRELVTNPLRLSLLCQVFYRNPNPNFKLQETTKAGLYKIFVRNFYEDWKAEQHPISDSELPRQLNQALGELALAGLDNKYTFKRFRLPEESARQVMTDKLFELAENIGWLNIVDRDANDEAVYAFWHPTFQEYFAACAIDDWDYFLPRKHNNFPIPDKQYIIFSPEWTQVILFWLGRGDVADQEKEDFIKMLVQFNDGCGEWNDGNDEVPDRGFYAYHAYFLAAAGLAEFKKCSSSLTHNIVNKIIDLRFGYLYNPASEVLSILIKQSDIALIETNQQIVINCLIERLVEFLDGLPLYYSRYITDFLCEIAVDNKFAIDNLMFVLKNQVRDKKKYKSILNILRKIAINYQDKLIDKIWKKYHQNDQDNQTEIKLTSNDTSKHKTKIKQKLNLTKNDAMKKESSFRILKDLDNPEYESFFRVLIEEVQCVIEEVIVPQKSKESFFRDLVEECQRVQEEVTLDQKSKETKLSNLLILLSQAKTKTEINKITNSIENILLLSPTTLLDLSPVLNYLKIDPVLELYPPVLELYPIVINSLKQYLNYHKIITIIDVEKFDKCYKILWNISQKIPYPKFYWAWDKDRNLIAEKLEAQQDICSQLQPVSNKIFCCLEQLEILVKETDIAEIAQELANQIFDQIARNERIPTIKGKSDLKRELANLTISLQVEKIALIFDLRGLEINPDFKQSALYQIALWLAKPPKISIAWISDRIANHPLNIDPPMRGFISEQDNLLDVLQNWLNDV